MKDVDKMNKELEIVDVDSNLSITLKVVGATTIEDEYGTLIVLDKIIPGHLVNVKYDTNNYETESIKIAAQVQPFEILTIFLSMKNFLRFKLEAIFLHMIKMYLSKTPKGLWNCHKLAWLMRLSYVLIKEKFGQFW